MPSIEQRSVLFLLVVFLASVAGCSTTTTPMDPKAGGGAGTGDPTATSSSQEKDTANQGAIEGDLERKKRQMRIWGEVERLRQGEHATLPPLTATPTGGEDDPVTVINNQTTVSLKIWFAGECSHQVDVPPEKTVTAVFCPGNYHLAATANNEAFLPLVRENQEFASGVQYKLEFFVRKAPQQ